MRATCKVSVYQDWRGPQMLVIAVVDGLPQLRPYPAGRPAAAGDDTGLHAVFGKCRGAAHSRLVRLLHAGSSAASWLAASSSMHAGSRSVASSVLCCVHCAARTRATAGRAWTRSWLRL